MEGVVDFHMRRFLTQIGGFDLCTTEFVRVVDYTLPKKVYLRFAPELFNQGATASGVPLRVQLLGQDPECLAKNAERAIALGSNGLDLNFGCPAKTVNKSKGGAALLKTPDTIYQVVKAVREALPKQHSVSAKIRLGFDDTSLATEIASAIQSAGADELTVHARTKKDGYRPPAYWEWLPIIRQHVSIPLIVNGEIWSYDDFLRCKEVSQCDAFMLGRGALAKPDLALEIKTRQQGKAFTPLPWQRIMQQFREDAETILSMQPEKYFSMRAKQWLCYLKLNYPEAEMLFNQIKRLTQASDVLKQIETHL